MGVDYDATGEPSEEYWFEFMGTFYEGDNRVTGLELDVVLRDGSKIRWRYRGTVGELILAVVRGED